MRSGRFSAGTHRTACPKHRIFIPRPWPQCIVASIAARTACRYLWPSQAGELLRDSKASEGENVRDHRSNSTGVSFVIPPSSRWSATHAGSTQDPATRANDAAPLLDLGKAVPGPLVVDGRHSIDFRLMEPKVESWTPRARRSELRRFPLCTADRLGLSGDASRRSENFLRRRGGLSVKIPSPAVADDFKLL